MTTSQKDLIASLEDGSTLHQNGSLWRHAWLRLKRKKTAMGGLAIIIVFSILAIAAPLISPHNPFTMYFGKAYLPPAWVNSQLKESSTEFLLGTDSAGRDLLSRAIYGARTSMVVAWLAVPIAALLGALVGLISGYAGGRVDNTIMRIVDVLYSFPQIMFYVLITLILRKTPFGLWLNGVSVLVVAFAGIAWVGLARLMRGVVLTLKGELYVEAAQALGASHRRILFSHILPNCLGTLVIWGTFALPRAIMVEALLGYIGIQLGQLGEGTDLTVISWGGMFFEGRRTIHAYPATMLTPAICVTMISMGFTFLGDGLRDALDTRVREIN